MEIIKTKEFTLYQMTDTSDWSTADTFAAWQKNNKNYKVVGITPFAKTTYSQPNQSQQQQQANVVGQVMNIPIPQFPEPYTENFFLVQYIVRDLNEQAGQLETYLSEEQIKQND